MQKMKVFNVVKSLKKNIIYTWNITKSIIIKFKKKYNFYILTWINIILWSIYNFGKNFKILQNTLKKWGG